MRVQCFLILFPAIISIFYPLQEIAYGILSLVGIDVKKFDEILKSIIDNKRVISIICGVVISIFIYIWRTKANKEKLFNTGNNYNEYPFWVYWVASKILGYGKVSLVRVPIYLQYKLLLKDVFPEIVVDNDVEEINHSIIVIEKNMEYPSNELNLVLIDTYEITDSQIPTIKTQLPTIFIKSGNETDSNRSFNPEFIKEVRRKTNALCRNYKQLNVFATTNTNHNQLIVYKCFKNGSRTGFENIIVYQASRSNYVFNRGYTVL
ncbi:hypothetical protein [Cytobacillus oceanisediminis]|uniref:hypothetical protein n=1 Tax=Cytobacillus oceanisediminis TaxID=665099 RepID=UPI001CF1BF1C|nr:hypothetical protein [Cytobacillus oceanisediminis]